MTDATATTTAPLSIQQAAVKRALAMLNAAGAAYAVQFDGETYGTLEVVPPRRRRANGSTYRRGETRSHYVPMIEHMVPGDAATVPFDRFDPAILASNISSYCVHTWGAGAAMTARNDETGCVEVLRLA